MSEWNERADFDQYAGHYDDSINRALLLSGEKRDYFALKRIEWLAGCLKKRSFASPVVMDFGCGTGTAAPLLLDILEASAYIGVDTSPLSLDLARKSQPGCFYELRRFTPAQQIEIIYCNSVFNHFQVREL